MTITGWEAVTLAGMTVAAVGVLYWDTWRKQRRRTRRDEKR